MNNLKPNDAAGFEIAVIGMSGKFPGASNIREFWNNLKNGVESIFFFSREELLDMGIDRDLVGDPNYIRAKGVLEDVEYFDSSFFDYTSAEAEMMDPQMRIFHQCAWEAFEDAGYDPYFYEGLIGVYAGSAYNHNWMNRFLAQRFNLAELFEAGMLNDRDHLSTRISYKLDLKGPSFTLQTACSTSLVAIHQACQGLLSGECDMALAGGVSIILPKKMGYPYIEELVFSSDGHCRAFDNQAKGTVFGDGIGIVVLKRLSEGLESRDNIYAVIKGSAINNDGNKKVGYTAPSIDGQAEVIRAAMAMAEVEPESIEYIETHGTGTIMGDPIEIEGLTRAFNTHRKHFCGIGSIKTNVGHLNVAAGVAGFLKAVLVLKHHQIPPSLHFERSNSKIDFDISPFYVNTTLKEWKSNGYPRRAAVSSFGIGGTNAHIILEEAPLENSSVGQCVGKSVNRPYQLILLSARTQPCLEKMRENTADFLKEKPNINLADAAYTLQVGREAFEHRMRLVCSDAADAVENLVNPGSIKAKTFFCPKKNRPVIFMFSGQGSQYVNMGRGLYHEEPIFREEVDRCFHILGSLTNENIKDILFPEHIEDSEAAQEKMNNILYSGPIKMLFEYSLAKLLMKLGIKPRAMIGHSIGEYTAACLSGVFSLEDGLKLAVLRGQLMHKMPEGAMMSVPMPEEELKSLLNHDLSIAAVNTPSLCIVSGPSEAVNRLKNQLEVEGNECLRLNVCVAGHSQMMIPFKEEFIAHISKIKLNKPQIPYISGLRGTWITEEQATSPYYWGRHMTGTLRFADGIGKLIKEINPIFVQVGPDQGLSLCVYQHPLKKKENIAINIIPLPNRKKPDVYCLLSKIGQLWGWGIEIDWSAFYENEKRYRIPMPTYPFTRTRYGVDIALSPSQSRKKAESADWFYLSSLKSCEQPGNNDDGTDQKGQLIFIDPHGLGKKIVERMDQYGEDVIVIKKGGALIASDQPKHKIHPCTGQEDVEPVNKKQHILVKIWKEFFALEQISIHDDFYELGGDSLKAVMIVNRIRQECGVKISLKEFFTRPTIEKLTGYIDRLETRRYENNLINPAEKKEFYTLSPAQKRLYILQQMNKASIVYNIPAVMVLEGVIDYKKLEEIFLRLIKRHGSFRTSFEIIGNQPVQKGQDKVDFKIQYYGNTEGQEGEARETCNLQSETAIIKNFIRPFDLSQAPLLRVGLIKLANGPTSPHIFMIDMHHIIADGVSMEIFLNEFTACYDGEELPHLGIQYKDYSEWWISEKESERMIKQEEYWLKQFEEGVPFLELPTDYNKPANENPEGGIFRFEINRELFKKIKKNLLEINMTLFMLLFAAYSVLLSVITGSDDILVGSPAAGRTTGGMENIIGMFVNMVALRNFPSGKRTFREFLKGVKENTLNAFDNQDYQFDQLVKSLGVSRNSGINPLINTVFTLQSTDFFKITELGHGRHRVNIKTYPHDITPAKFDLALDALEKNDSINMWFTYSTSLFKRATIGKLKQYYIEILEQAMENLDIRIKDISISDDRAAAKANLRNDRGDFNF